MRPRVVLKAAISLNGVLDDSSPKRLILSSPEDADAVDELRASCDAILVGAETVRRDDPKLRIRSAARIAARVAAGRPPQPLKVTLTRGGQLPPSAAIFTGTPPLVYATEGSPSLANAEVVCSATSLHLILADLRQRGVETLLVEGGSKILAQFLDQALFDELRLAIAPRTVSDPNAVRVRGNALQQLRIVRTEMLGQMSVLHLVP